MKEVKIIKFKSEPGRTFFAPEFDYTIFETSVEQVNFQNLAKFILNKEKEILSLPVSGNAYTGLNKNNTTTRFNEYNVLKWEGENIKHLKGNIVNFHNGIMQYFKQPIPNELYIKCWTNIMRKGEQIKPHIHNIGPNTYLGGHICVQCDDTSTHYINPINHIIAEGHNDPMTHSSKNDIGKITIFPMNVPHYTDITPNSNNERITIAFELLIENPNDNNYLKLI